MSDIFSLLGKGASASKVSKPQGSEHKPTKVGSKEGSKEGEDPKAKGLTKAIDSVQDRVVEDAKQQKESSTRWKLRGTHLIYNTPAELNLSRYLFEDGASKYVKVAAFDLDDTLVTTKTGQKFSRGPADWQWWKATGQSESKVMDTIHKLQDNKYIVAIFTNQGAVVANSVGPKSKSYANFAGRVDLVLGELQKGRKGDAHDVLVFASPKRPGKKAAGALSTEAQHQDTRKPNTGMWKALVEYLNQQYRGDDELIISLEHSFYVGDAAGRPNDFSDSDMKFASNANLKFKVPEDAFCDDLR